jgi:hypothetical protein
MNHNPEKWFKHSIDSHNEPQMRRIKARFGKLNGYAMYYISIEIMMRSGGWIEHDDIETYADDYGVDCDELERFFSYCVSIEAFILVDNKYSADTVQETLEKRKRISEVRSEAGAIGGKAKAQAQSEPETPAPKPKQPSLAPEIIEHWNANAKALRCKKLTSDIEKAVAKRCKEYTLAEIKQGIENYHAIVNDPDCFFSYQWNLAEFLSRANGFPVFSGERDEIVGKYRKDTAPKPEPPQRVKTPEEIALGEERRKMIMERAGFGK